MVLPEDITRSSLQQRSDVVKLVRYTYEVWEEAVEESEVSDGQTGLEPWSSQMCACRASSAGGRTARL